MRGDRLLTILLLLQKAGRLTARELAKRLEVSERTVHRDMDALSAAGVPVYAERGAAGGWRLTDGYRTDLTGMNREELKSLLCLAVSAPAADLGLDGPLHRALLKLSAAVPFQHRAEVEAVRNRLHIDGAPWYPREEAVPLLGIVQEAVWGGKQMSILYRKQGQTETERLISPLGLVVKGSAWYVVADTDGGLRSFRISRLVHAFETGVTFERPKGFDLAAYWEQSTSSFKAGVPRFEAELRFQPGALPLLSRIRRDRVLCASPPDAAGYVTALIRFDTPETACLDVLGFGPAVEVTAPDALRAMLRELAAGIHAKYAAGAPV